MEKTNFFMEHYFYLKKMYPADEILLFRCGDFYEAYIEEACNIPPVQASEIRTPHRCCDLLHEGFRRL